MVEQHLVEPDGAACDAGMAVITLVALAFAREARADDEPAVPPRPARFEREPEYDTVGR